MIEYLPPEAREVLKRLPPNGEWTNKDRKLRFKGALAGMTYLRNKGIIEAREDHQGQKQLRRTEFFNKF